MNSRSFCLVLSKTSREFLKFFCKFSEGFWRRIGLALGCGAASGTEVAAGVGAEVGSGVGTEVGSGIGVEVGSGVGTGVALGVAAGLGVGF